MSTLSRATDGPQVTLAPTICKEGKWVDAMRKAYDELQVQFPKADDAAIAAIIAAYAAVSPSGEIQHGHRVRAIVGGPFSMGNTQEIGDKFEDLIIQQVERAKLCNVIECSNAASFESVSIPAPDGSVKDVAFGHPFCIFANGDISNEAANKFRPYSSQDDATFIANDIMSHRPSGDAKNSSSATSCCDADLNNLFVV